MTIRKQRIAVLGAGQIGAIIAEMLAGQGHEVTLADASPVQVAHAAGKRFATETVDAADLSALRNADYLIAIVPSLLAWAALAAPAPWDLRILGGLVLAWGFIDQDLPRRGLVPVWLGRLRLVLSGVAGAALLIAA